MRLINGNGLSKKFKDSPWDTFSRQSVVNMIDGEPTAFNVRVVLDKLIARHDYCHELSGKNLGKNDEMATHWMQRAEGVRDAIEILKEAINTVK